MLAATDVPLHRLTSAQYDALVATGALEGERVELLDGLVTAMSPQELEHRAVVTTLLRLFASRADLLQVQMTFPAAEGWRPEPDVLLGEESRPGLVERPRLVVEVSVTTRAYDRRKLPGYLLGGVPRVWLVDVPERRVHDFAGPRRGRYSMERVLCDTDVLDTGVEGIEPFSVARLFELALPAC